MAEIIIAIIGAVISIVSSVVSYTQSEKTRATQEKIGRESQEASEKQQADIKRETERKVLSDESANRGMAIARFAELK